MRNQRIAAIIWLLAGLAFLVAGLLVARHQTAFFAVAVLFFAVSSITTRRARASRRSV